MPNSISFSKIDRRSFLRGSVAAAVGAMAVRPAWGRSANETLQVAVVGCAGQGLYDLSQIGSHRQVKFTGFCDVDRSRFEGARQAFPGVPEFQDYREMFAKLGDKIDGVLVSTPDHWHANIALAALSMKKHVYCQKPLTHTVWEARQLTTQAAKQGVVTQMGNQIHSHEAYRTGVAMLQQGVIGKIKEVHSWQANKGNQFTKLSERPAGKKETPPETLDWDLWLGPAPARDYVGGLYAHFTWRDWKDFGGGTLGDFGCHILDPVFTALKLTAPTSIVAEVEEQHIETWPGAETVKYVFPGTKYTAASLPVTWYDGGRKPRAALAQMPAGSELPGGGSLLIGETGTMVLPHVALPMVYADGKVKEHSIGKEPDGNHYHAWVDACLSGGKTTDGFDYAGPLTEAINLGLIASRLPGETLAWDAAGLSFTNSKAAQKFVTKEYRAGFAPVMA